MSTSDPFAAPPERPGLNPYEHVGHTHLSRWGKTIQIALLLFGVVVALQLGRTFFAGSVAQPNLDVPRRTNDSAADPVIRGAVPYGESARAVAGPETGPPWVAKEAQIAHEHEVEAAKLLQKEFVQQADKLAKLLQEWRQELDLWHSDVESLLTNDAGKALAADAEAVHKFRAIFSQSRPGRDRLNEIHSLTEHSGDSVGRSLNDPDDAVRPDQGTAQKIVAYVAEARAAAVDWRVARSQIRTLVDDARQRGSAAQISLQDAIHAQEQVDNRAAAAVAEREKDLATKEAAVRVAKAKADAIRATGEIEARQILAGSAEALARQQSDEDRRKKEAELATRRAALGRDMADVKRYLAPFIVKGYAQPNGYFAAQTATAGPMSYSKIVAAGALKESREGMQLLVNYATRGNDRDRAGFPTCDGSEYQWAELNKEYVRRAQELLTLYGDLLVEQGLLSK